MNGVLAARDRPSIAPDTLRHMVGFGARSLIEQAFAVTGAEARAEEMPELWTIFLDHYRAHLADFSRPFPGVEETLARLKENGARLGVLTNKPHDMAGPLLEKLDLARSSPPFMARASSPTASPIRASSRMWWPACGGGDAA